MKRSLKKKWAFKKVEKREEEIEEEKNHIKPPVYNQ